MNTCLTALHNSLHFNTRIHFIFQRLVVFAPLEDLMPRLGCLIASISLHKTLLAAIMRAPLTFFDTTPTGRILSRFSKDIEVIDNKIPMELSDLVYVACEVIFFSKVFFVLSSQLSHKM